MPATATSLWYRPPDVAAALWAWWRSNRLKIFVAQKPYAYVHFLSRRIFEFLRALFVARKIFNKDPTKPHSYVHFLLRKFFEEEDPTRPYSTVHFSSRKTFEEDPTKPYSYVHLLSRRILKDAAQRLKSVEGCRAAPKNF